MKIIIGKNSGFCSGVRYTITRTLNELEKSNTPIDCLGEIIHNRQVVEDLENKGLHIIDSIDEANSKVIIRAHGTTKDTYELATKKELELIDLTCPKVLKIHEQVESFSSHDYFIFLCGSKNHPETIGTFSFCGNNSFIIENISDVSLAILALKNSGLKNALLISQTTFSLKLFDEIERLLSRQLSNDYNLHIENSICNATSTRQEETYKLSKEVELMIIIGGKNSSNTKKLYEIAKSNCKNAILIETKDDLDLDFIKNFETIGIMAGASTPDVIINDVYDYCIQ